MTHGSASLPTLRPVIPGRSSQAAHAPTARLPGTAPPTLSGLLRAVIVAVNARGMCAASAARIAALPARDLADITAQCRCTECLRQRAQ